MQKLIVSILMLLGLAAAIPVPPEVNASPSEASPEQQIAENINDLQLPSERRQNLPAEQPKPISELDALREQLAGLQQRCEDLVAVNRQLESERNLARQQVSQVSSPQITAPLIVPKALNPLPQRPTFTSFNQPGIYQPAFSQPASCASGDCGQARRGRFGRRN